MGEWINKLLIHIQWNIYSVLRMKEIQIHVTTHMILTDIMLIKISQSQKEVLYDPIHMGAPEVDKFRD